MARALVADEKEVMGVNDRAQLAGRGGDAGSAAGRAMIEGATLIAPDTVFLSFDAEIGRDVLIDRMS